MQPSKTTKNIWSKMLSVALSIVLMAGFVSPTALAFAEGEEINNATDTETTDASGESGTDGSETDSATGGEGTTSSDTPTEGDGSTGGEGTSSTDAPTEDNPVVTSESSKPMYRLYNPNSGEHHYTTNVAERNTLEDLGWCDEGICWYAPSTSDTPIYRLYSPDAEAHHYTRSTYECDALVDAGWKYEGIGWYSDDAKGVPVYRGYNPNYRMAAGAHSYTTSKDENTLLVRMGWKQEGIAWYGTDVASDISDSSEDLSGQCGSGVSWEINSDGQLHISGNGTLDAVSNKESWWYPYREQITSVVVDDGVIANADSSSLFAFLPNAKSIDISGLDTSNVTNMCRMFSCCNSLTSLDLSAFNTSNVTGMRWMFFDCFNLSSLDLSAFDTSDVTDMGMMFLRCLSLTSVDVSKFDTSNVTDMSAMFDYSYLSDLDLSSFDISSNPKTNYILSGCYKLSRVTLPAEGDFSGLLPTPNSDYISGATGKWTNTKGKTFTSDKIPANVADTYVAARSVAEEDPGIVDEPVKPVVPAEPEEPVEADVPASDDSDFDGGINFSDDDANKKFQEFIDDKGDWHFVLEKHGDMDEKKREAIDRDIVTPNRKVAEELDIFIQGEKERISIPGELDIWMTIRIKMTDSMKLLKPDTIVVFYVSDEGTVESMSTKVDGDYVTFVTKHFSTYVVAGEEQTDNTPTGGEQDGTPAGDSTQAATVTMYRLYNPNSGEHFYTADSNEKSHLISLGWNDEGTGWIAPTSGDPVYRLYNPNAGEHHFTKDIAEKESLEKAGWTFERIGWYSGGDVRLYREYNSNAYANNHNYTPDKGEHDWLLSLGWDDEGYAWNAVAAK